MHQIDDFKEESDRISLHSTLELIQTKQLAFVLRVCMRISLVEAAERTGINKVSLGEIERRTRPPLEEEARAIRDLLMGKTKVVRKAGKRFRLVLRATTETGQEAVLEDRVVEFSEDSTSAMCESQLNDMVRFDLGKIVTASWSELP